jgi:hypothetical protein
MGGPLPLLDVKDNDLAKLASQQYNRVAREQLLQLGLSHDAIEHRVGAGRLVRRESGVLAMAPVREDDDWGRWMEATLTAPGTLLSHDHAAVAWNLWSHAEGPTTVTRVGSGGSRLFGGVLVFWSTTLDGDATRLRGIPITSVPRTLLDLAPRASQRALARAVRESVRLELTTLRQLGDSLGRYRRRRGVRRLAATIARYAGLPLERARSGAEIRAMEILRDAGRPMPTLNVRINGEEADLSWPRSRLIVEIDGGPFHLDAGEDARKEEVWRSAGWKVRRLSSDDVYDRPDSLLAITPPPNVGKGRV